jgi:hypothetical protein
MATTPRPVDLLTGAFDLNQRRRFNIKKEDGAIDRKRATALTTSEEALDISTQMLCHMAELEDGTKAFAAADAAKLQRELPESVLNELELFLFGLGAAESLEEAKND